MNKKLIAVAVSSALTAPMAAQAVDFKTSGHINRMIRFADNGQGSDVQFTDNTSSRSRVRFVGSSDVGNGMKAGVNLEIGFGSNRQFPGGSPDIKDADGGDSVGDIRHSALWFSGNWGKVHMGHTSGAADGMTGADLRGTWMADPQTSFGACSQCSVRGRGATGALRSFHRTFDGGRLDLLRYDSPKLGPAQIRVSASNNERWEAGAYVNTDVGGGALALAAGYIANAGRGTGANTSAAAGAAAALASTGLTADDVKALGGAVPTNANKEVERFGVSGSFRFSQGTSIKLTYSEEDNEDRGTPDAEDFFASIGHKWGANAVSVSYGTTDWGPKEGTRWGIGWQHEMSKPGVTIYAGYHNFDNDGGRGTNVKDFDIFRMGTRVQFK